MLKKVELSNFRNLNLSVELAEQGNLIIAPNASGKSNFLESIYLVGTGHGFTPIQDWTDIIGPSEKFAKINITQSDLEIEWVVAKKDFKIVRNIKKNTKRAALGETIGEIAQTLFAPHNVDLISGSPLTRRQDLDDYLCQVDKIYAENLFNYTHVVKQRNALLKQINKRHAQASELYYWDEQVATLGSAIYSTRREFIDQVRDLLTKVAVECYREELTEFKVNYQPQIDAKPEEYHQVLLNKLVTNLDKQIIIGQTLYGPHKDDYTFTLGERNLRFMGSRGEQRLAVLVWKLAQHHYLETKTGKKSVLLLDDLTSELDTTHRVRTAEMLLDRGYQFIITSATAADVPEVLIQRCQEVKLMQ